MRRHRTGVCTYRCLDVVKCHASYRCLDVIKCHVILEQYHSIPSYVAKAENQETADRRGVTHLVHTLYTPVHTLYTPLCTPCPPAPPLDLFRCVLLSDVHCHIITLVLYTATSSLPSNVFVFVPSSSSSSCACAAHRVVEAQSVQRARTHAQAGRTTPD